MKTNVRAQFGGLSAAPILAIASIAVMLSLGLGTIDRTQRQVADLTALESTAHDIVLQEYLHRFGRAASC